MNARFLAVLLGFCALSTTVSAAKPRLVADAITVARPLTLKQAGPATLAGIEPVGEAALKPGPVEVKRLGQDRFGQSQIIAYRPGGNQSIQEELLRAGQALAYDRAASPKPWLKAEAEARAAKRGVWGSTTYISSPATAEKSMGKFRLVTGNVTSSYKGRDMWWLNFGEDWKTDFSLRIPRKAWRSFGKEFAVTDGSCLRARGVIFLDNGPAIEVTRPEQLERLDANAC